MSDAPGTTLPPEVEVRGLILDPVSNSPIIILKRPDDNVFLPIWIGVFEANAIALELEGVQTPRPMTHDLLRDVVASLDAEVESVVVHALQDSTFLARLDLVASGGRRISVDARPSDAIALALRCRAPIRVTASVFDAAQAVAMEQDGDPEERLREWLASLTPEQLGKYRM